MKAIIGDVHGKFSLLQKIIKNNPGWKSVTIVGDVGLGFTDSTHVPFDSPIPIHFIRGNHDNPEFIRTLNDDPKWANNNWYYIPDGTIENGVLYAGGAYSRDVAMRTPGVNWWPEEELNGWEQDRIMGDVRDYKGMLHTVITHDCPLDLYPTMYGNDYQFTRTSVFLRSLLTDLMMNERLRPLRWFYGHHHKALKTHRYGIRFQCINMIESNDKAYL